MVQPVELARARLRVIRNKLDVSRCFRLWLDPVGIRHPSAGTDQRQEPLQRFPSGQSENSVDPIRSEPPDLFDGILALRIEYEVCAELLDQRSGFRGAT